MKALTVVLSLAAVLLTCLRFEPRIAVAQRARNDAGQMLRNDEVAFASAPLLRSERNALSREVGALLLGQPEATFVRDLARIVRRRHVRVVSTSFQHAPEARKTPAASGSRMRMEREQGSLALEGSYASLLEAIADLSRGGALISVGTPSIRRSATALIALVPLTLFEPPRGPAP
jgi:hypothetical protein